MPLAGIRRATRVRLSLVVRGAEAANDWDIWVYPKQLAVPAPSELLTTRSLDATALERLQQGGKVLVVRQAAPSNPNLLPMQFLPVFWSLSWFPKQPGMLGILCDPHNPALADFPTDMHSDWQWWELTEGARAFLLDDTPPGFRPIVQVIDDYHRNHKLGAVFETRVGKGKLLAVSMDLSTNLEQRPVARQLLYSLTRYQAGDRFDPRDELPLGLLRKLLSE